MIITLYKGYCNFFACNTCANQENNIALVLQILIYIYRYLCVLIYNLAKISAERTQPIMFPKCGTLLTYGRADVTNTFLSPFLGNLKKRT